MAVKVKKINIKAFRGIPELELNLNGKGLLLKGDNGTGKSSIVDALEFFFCGRVNHLEGVQGITLQRHAPHVFYKPEEVKVSLSFDPGEIVLDRTFENGPTCPNALDAYFVETQTGVFILRRAQVLEFIISKPADRFRTLGSIIGIEDLDDIELAMMRAKDGLEADSTGKVGAINICFQQLSRVLGKEVGSEVEVLDVLNKILKTADLPKLKSLEETEAHAAKIWEKARAEEAVRKIGRLEELSLELKGIIIDEAGILKAIDAVNEKIGDLLKENVKKERSIASLLEIGVKVMEEWELDACPLCQQDIKRDEVLGQIKGRLGTLEALSERASEIRRECAAIKRKLDETLRSLNKVPPKTVEFPELAEKNEVLTKQIDSISKFIGMVDTAAEAENKIPTDALKDILTNTNNLISDLSKKSDSLFEAEKITESEKEVLRIVGIMGQVKSKVEEISKTRTELESIKKRFGIARAIYSKFTSIKREKVQEVFDVIQSDIEKYYTMLHPGDAHKNIELKLPVSRRASLELRIESFGRRDEDPRAYSSEGHLDSFGLCIFLAFVKKFNSACSLVVLDDVVTTVDAGHRENICKLLIEEFSDKQLIITTHENLWYEQLRNHHRAAKVEGNFNYLAVERWEVSSGPTIRPYKPRWERILEKIDNNDKSVGNEGRTYMEWTLEAICDSLEAQVIFRNSREWDIGELFSSAKNRAEHLINDDKYKEGVSKAFQNLANTIIYGNIISHNNPLAEELTITEIGNFCNAVHSLYCTFLCPNCGSILRYIRGLKIVRCSNPKCDKPFEVKAS